MSALRDSLAEYLAMRRAFGATLREPATTLGRFVEFLDGEGATFITTDLAVRWARQSGPVQPATWARRLSMARLFAAWVSTSDPRNEVPPRGLLEARHRRSRPHIFTEAEIGALIAHAARLPSPTGLRAWTFQTLIGLLAATGLRPGEAMALDQTDVDLDNGILTIRQTKFGKARFVPIDDSARVALQEYARRRGELRPRPQADAFLLSEHGRRLDGPAARRTFAKLTTAIGLRPPVTPRRWGRGPRLQDLRHTFATRRLLEWYRAGLDVQREMPKLSTYLGHVEVAHTYWYIEAIPELLELATESLDRRRSGGTP